MPQLQQPNSIPNDEPHIVDLVITDLEERAEFGEQKYGTRLQANNGRCQLLDLYQELQDATLYIKAKLVEKEKEDAIKKEIAGLFHPLWTTSVDGYYYKKEWQAMQTLLQQLGIDV